MQSDEQDPKERTEQQSFKGEQQTPICNHYALQRGCTYCIV